MARTESRTKTAIWSDKEFTQLTSRAQRMYWLLYSQSTISLCGVLALTERRWAATAPDETIETVRGALGELTERGFILIDEDTEEVFIRTFARHDGVARSPKTFAPAWGQLQLISSERLREAAETELRSLGQPPDGYPIPSSVDSPPIPYSENGSGPQDTSRVRAHAASSLQSPSPSPTSKSCLPPDGDLALSAELLTDEDDIDLAERLMNACVGAPSVIAAEAAAVVLWAKPHVSRNVIEEAIGWAESKRGAPRPPRFPRTVAGVIADKAADAGNTIPAFIA